MNVELVNCAVCKTMARLALVCSNAECGKVICADCALDPEKATGMCWMCLDWTPAGQAKKAQFRPKRKEKPDTPVESRPEPLPAVVALYADGGCIGRNPSEVGGTWAWCGVDASGRRVIERGGVVPAKPGRPVTNNHTEQIAITLALEAMPEGWSGTLYSDSNVALGRVFKGWATNNLPRNISERSAKSLARLGRIESVLLQGHPTKEDLARGVGAKRGFPVSEHNVWCDEECNRQAQNYRAGREQAA